MLAFAVGEITKAIKFNCSIPLQNGIFRDRLGKWIFSSVFSMLDFTHREERSKELIAIYGFSRQT